MSTSSLQSSRVPLDRQQAEERNRLLAEAMALIGPFSLCGVEARINLLHETLEFDRQPTNRHTHETYELSFMTVGDMEYKVGGQRILLTPRKRNVLCVPPQTEHIRAPLSSPSLVTGFQLAVAATRIEAKPFVESLPDALIGQGCEFDADARLRAVIDAWRGEVDHPLPLARLSLSLLIREFLLLFFRNAFAEPLASLESDVAAKTRLVDSGHLAMKMSEFVEENLGEKISLKMVATRFDMSERHANRVFTSATGASLGVYIIQRKMRQAAWELLNTDRMVKIIATELGYDDVGHFSRTFAKLHGAPPERYRHQKSGMVQSSRFKGSTVKASHTHNPPTVEP